VKKGESKIKREREGEEERVIEGKGKRLVEIDR
jgi:hypothetical protein